MISKEQNARLMLNRIRSSLSNTEVNEELRLASLLDKLDARLKRLSLFDKLENPSFWSTKHQRAMISKEQNPSFLSAKQPQRAMISEEQC